MGIPDLPSCFLPFVPGPLSLILMHYCVAYDVRSNRLRRKTIILCQQAGLRRVQKSVFAGRSSPALMADLERDIRTLLPPTDRFMLIPIDAGARPQLVLFGAGEPTKHFAEPPVIRHF